MWCKALGTDACECCGREFGLPVRLTVSSGGPEMTYFACPFCFSRVKEAEVEAPVKTLEYKERDRVRERREAGAVKLDTWGCAHHLGYLKGRVKHSDIPDECLICPKIFQCMT